MQETMPEATPAPAEATVLPPPPQPASHPFRFTGTTGGYFRIWIVNLFLTIITVGLYSPWAKVRKKRYVYGHTWVADSNFEYHGNPIAILKGRLIAGAALAVYYGVGHFMPKVAAALALVLFAAAPWFIARSMAFNAFNSSYRNIRFRFVAGYKDVLKAIWPMAVVLIFPLLLPEIDPEGKTAPPALFWVVILGQFLALSVVYPAVVGGLKRLHVTRSSYGVTAFSLDMTLGDFYLIYLKSYLLLFGVGIGGIIIFSIVGFMAAFVMGKSAASAYVFTGLIMVGYFFVAAIQIAYTRSRVNNMLYSRARLGGTIRFESKLAAMRLAAIYLTNLLAITFSLGLAVPWATMRALRYRAEVMTVIAESSLDEMLAGMNAEVGATGEELGEFLSIDLSL